MILSLLKSVQHFFLPQETAELLRKAFKTLSCLIPTLLLNSLCTESQTGLQGHWWHSQLAPQAPPVSVLQTYTLLVFHHVLVLIPAKLPFLFFGQICCFLHPRSTPQRHLSWHFSSTKNIYLLFTSLVMV